MPNLLLCYPSGPPNSACGRWSVETHLQYLQGKVKQHKLPYHPLWDEGYVSIGDVHTTRSLADVTSAEETRFFGLQRECGLHEMDFGQTA